MTTDWFSQQLTSVANVLETTSPPSLSLPENETRIAELKPLIQSRRASPRVAFTTSVRNATFYPFVVQLNCSVRSDTRVKSCRIDPIMVEPNSDISVRLHPSIGMNETFLLSSVEAVSTLGKYAGEQTTALTLTWGKETSIPYSSSTKTKMPI